MQANLCKKSSHLQFTWEMQDAGKSCEMESIWSLNLCINMSSEQLEFAMRLIPLAAILLLASVSGSGQSQSPTALAQLPTGTLTGNIYSNDALGVTFHIPPGWTANLDGSHPLLFGNDPHAPANHCTRILMRFQAPHKVKGWFTAWGVLIAIDPDCLGAGPFPVSGAVQDAEQINDFAEKLYQIYHPAPFFPPGGVDISANPPEGPRGSVTVALTGKGLRDVDDSDPSIKRTPVPISTLFSITQAPKFWIAWAELADDRSNTELARGTALEVKSN